jgi:hypothetical protein
MNNPSLLVDIAKVFVVWDFVLELVKNINDLNKLKNI